MSNTGTNYGWTLKFDGELSITSNMNNWGFISDHSSTNIYVLFDLINVEI